MGIGFFLYNLNTIRCMILLPIKKIFTTSSYYLNKKKFLFFVYILFISFLSPAYIYAQQLSPEIIKTISGLSTEKQTEILKQLSDFSTQAESTKKAIQEDLAIKINPIYPTSNEKVTATIISNITDINRADIFWYVDDKLKASGNGLFEFEFETKNIGEVITIDVVLKTYEGFRVDKRLTINPAEIDILWEAETYTPPFYKGKALLTPKAKLKLVVMPNFTTPTGRALPANKLIYTWGEGVEILRRDSGYGKNVLYTEAPIMFWEKNISVNVSSFDNSLRGYKKINLNVTLPEVVLYEDKPIEGVWYGEAIGRDFEILKQELVIKAEPFFFDESDRKNGDLIYDWKMEGKPVVGENDKITFKQQGGEGSTRIDLNLKNIAKRFQYAAKSFVLDFKSAGLFNF